MAQRFWKPQDFNLKLCRAKACPEDADGYWGLCSRHARLLDAGRSIEDHQNPPQTGPLLWCGACRTDKPDAEFPMRPNHGKEPGRRQGMRRDRYWCCNECIDKGRTK